MSLREAAVTVYELTRLFVCGHRSVKQASPSRTAELECANEMCSHMRSDAPHPVGMQGRDGRRWWRYEDGSLEPRR